MFDVELYKNIFSLDWLLLFCVVFLFCFCFDFLFCFALVGMFLEGRGSSFLQTGHWLLLFNSITVRSGTDYLLFCLMSPLISDIRISFSETQNSAWLCKFSIPIVSLCEAGIPKAIKMLSIVYVE